MTNHQDPRSHGKEDNGTAGSTSSSTSLRPLSRIPFWENLATSSSTTTDLNLFSAAAARRQAAQFSSCPPRTLSPPSMAMLPNIGPCKNLQEIIDEALRVVAEIDEEDTPLFPPPSEQPSQ